MIMINHLYHNIKTFLFYVSGHTRYSTVGGSDITNIQPFVVETLHGLISVAHNGELVNSAALKHKVSRAFSEFLDFKPLTKFRLNKCFLGISKNKTMYFAKWRHVLPHKGLKLSYLSRFILPGWFPG